MQYEIWKDIQGYESYYQISNTGKVRSLHRLVKSRGKQLRPVRSIILKFNITRHGYYQVKLSKHHKYTGLYVHKLIALHFIPNPENYPQVNHKDGNKLNNSIDNLEWCTQKQNTIHAYRTGLAKGNPGSANSQAILTEEIVKAIYETKGAFTVAEIAAKYSVHRITIGAIFRGDSWNHVTGLPKTIRDENRKILTKRRYRYITRKETNSRGKVYDYK